MIPRPNELARLRTALARSRVVALIGPRQCGKSTLARQFVTRSSPHYFDLENPAHLGRLSEPQTALERLRGLVVIDEVQRRPDLFPLLRVLADRKPLPARFLILGSASPNLLRQSSESLAGRIETVAIGGLRLSDVPAKSHSRHWVRGGFPLSFTARREADSFSWREQFIQTFLERDVPQFGITIPATTLLRFWSMLAHYHGQIWNGAEIASAMALSQPTVRHYLDTLSDLFMVRQLPPWFANIAKRQVKSPKIYLRDSGLLNALLGITDATELEMHPKLGRSWEGYAIEEIIKHLQPDQAFFWATHAGAELDLLLLKNGRRIGVECKRVDAPVMTLSMHVALTDLKLDKLYVVYPGKQRYPLKERVEVVPLAEFVGRTSS